MGCFRAFTAPLWMLFAGDALLLFCSVFYMAWWLICFRPGSPGLSSGWALLALAFATGLPALVLLALSVSALNAASGGGLSGPILLGALALYLILLLVTKAAFHRPVTSELLIMLVWAAAQLCAVAALRGAGRFGPGRTAALAVLVGLATAADVVCYVLYYRLDAQASYWDGLVPLASDAAVMAVFLGVLAFS